MDQEQIRQHLLKSGIDWVKWEKNSPGASHMVGIWERQIRLARTILEALLKTHGSSLNEENLRTLITETKAMINSRPLTVEKLSDVNSEMPLSPSQLLTMKIDVILPPPGTFSSPGIYSMAMCSAHCWQILDTMEERISPNVTGKTEVEQSKVKLQR